MSNNVQSIERVFSILENFKKYPSGASLTKISEDTCLHKSTVHRLLNTLSNLGYIEQKSDSLYYITFRLYDLVASSIDELNIVDVANPYMKDLSELVNEVVHLVVQDDIYITYINKIEAYNQLVMASKIGSRAPLITTASGKSILANLPLPKIIEIWEKSLNNGITIDKDFLSFQKELDKIKNTKISYDLEYHETGVYCIGSPILNRNGDVVAAISISGPNFRMKNKLNDSLEEKIKKTTNDISHALGFHK